MPAKKKYTVTSKVKRWVGEMAAWHFAGVSGKKADEIREKYGKNHKEFGSIPVEVTIGKTTWKTSIFRDNRSKSYLLPIKASVRKAEGVYDGDEITFILELQP